METPEPSSLVHLAKNLKSVSSGVERAEKAKDLGEKVEALREALKAAKECHWASTLSALEEHLGRSSEALDKVLGGRREAVLQKLSEVGLPIKRFTDYDRVGPFRIHHKGSKTTVSFGKLEYKVIDDSDSGRVADVIAADVGRVVTGSPPDNFSKLIEMGVEHCRLEKHAGSDTWLRLNEIYREVWLAWQRSQFTGKFPKTPRPPDFPLVAFCVALAQWVRKGASTPGGFVFRMRTPPMSNESESFLIPNLSAGIGSEDLLFEGRLERVSGS
jgi:hypothetical protein